ncbi:ankyrin repeat domain-containing protein [Methylomagnum ishizawai]|uniref:ankyrin repeat domain-containing protein n=1 Tax=Methylomagnum ishizawai TaxID=1760988 RepID=UPI001C32BCBA|nr:ankyrin repeat domain-containing protein [Methylomagnum ishizawai]BBL75266.1 hypothetical protein MishRS11D_23640 [Methylomagnum ishizawai]
MIQQISIAAASALVRQKSPVILDVRDAAAYGDARIPGAIHATLSTIQSTVKKFRRDMPLLIYCYRGNNSLDCARLLANCGFSEVYSLEGGFYAWQKAGQAIEGPPRGPAVVKLNPVAEWLLEQGGDPGDANHPLPCGTPPLIKACQRGLADIVRGLVEAGADLRRADAYGNDALWAACYSDDVKTIAALLEAGIDINRRNPAGATGLIYAASAGKTEAVAYLLEAGADAQIKTQDDFTALDLAANLDILNLLRRGRRRLAGVERAGVSRCTPGFSPPPGV